MGFLSPDVLNPLGAVDCLRNPSPVNCAIAAQLIRDDMPALLYMALLIFIHRF